MQVVLVYIHESLSVLPYVQYCFSIIPLSPILKTILEIFMYLLDQPPKKIFIVKSLRIVLNINYICTITDQSRWPVHSYSLNLTFPSLSCSRFFLLFLCLFVSQLAHSKCRLIYCIIHGIKLMLPKMHDRWVDPIHWAQPTVQQDQPLPESLIKCMV